MAYRPWTGFACNTQEHTKSGDYHTISYSAKEAMLGHFLAYCFPISSTLKFKVLWSVVPMPFQKCFWNLLVPHFLCSSISCSRRRSVPTVSYPVELVEVCFWEDWCKGALPPSRICPWPRVPRLHTYPDNRPVQSKILLGLVHGTPWVSKRACCFSVPS